MSTTNEASTGSILEFDGKSSANPAPTKSSQKIVKRLQAELNELMMEMCMPGGVKGICAMPKDTSNWFEWEGHIVGPKDGIYEDRRYNLEIKFPEQYPHHAPTIKFVDAIFHPNVDQHGNICLDILKDQWSPVMKIKQVLLSLQSLLDDPNNDSPLNATAAAKWDHKPAYISEMKKVENKPGDKA